MGNTSSNNTNPIPDPNSIPAINHINNTINRLPEHSEHPEHLCGCCDTCKNKFYLGDTVTSIKQYQNTIFNIEYCDKDCLSESQEKYPGIQHLSYEQHTHVESQLGRHLPKIFRFITHHPWSVFYNANEMVSYIEELKAKESTTLTWRQRGFLDNYENSI
jgi:hypothetical protein